MDNQANELGTATPEYELARQRVKAIKRFYSALMRHISTIGILVALNLTITDIPWWIVGVVAVTGGINLVRKWIEAYTPNRFLSKSWEERKIQEIVAQERGEKPKRGSASDYFVDANADEDETYQLKRSG